MQNHQNIIRNFYSSPQAGGMAVFSGSRRQLGGSFLSGIARFALPILKFLAPKIASVGSHVLTDVIDKKPFGASLKKHGLAQIKRTLATGKGVKRRRRQPRRKSRLPINRKAKRRKISKNKSSDIFSKR